MGFIPPSTRGRALGAFVVLLALLSGCATRPPVPEAARAADWQAHRQALEALGHWAFAGRVAVRDSQHQSWNGAVDWSQRADRFDIRFSGPFGQGGARLSGQSDYAVIETREHSALSASSPEALMEEQLGWSVPLQGFRHWLVGAPAPGLIESYVLDEAGRLARLDQSGWQIRYRDYRNVDGLYLPRKLELENPRLRVRLVIDEWRLHGGANDMV